MSWAKPIYGRRHLVEAALTPVLGDLLGSVLVTDGGRLRVLVIGPKPDADARRVLGQIGVEDAEVLQVDQRFSTHAMNEVFGAVLASRPPDAVNETAISRESPLGRDHCPRIEIALLPPGQAAKASETWASEMQDRWGHDRVVTRRSRLELRGLAPTSNRH